MKDCAKTERWTLVDISMVLCHSDKTSKHVGLQCLHNAKGTKHFGGTDYLNEK